MTDNLTPEEKSDAALKELRHRLAANEVYENLPVVIELEGEVQIIGAAKLRGDQLFVIFSDDFTEDLQAAFAGGDVSGFSIGPVFVKPAEEVTGWEALDETNAYGHGTDEPIETNPDRTFEDPQYFDPDTNGII